MDENGVPNQQNQIPVTQNPNARNSDGDMTINSVLHFLQAEWIKLEQQRAQWEMDRAELQAQLAFLQGERKGQENLKQDLIRRIKMLEMALKAERAKQQKNQFTGQESNRLATKLDEEAEKLLLPAQRLKIEAEKGEEFDEKWKQSRARLKQYLEEVSSTDLMLNQRQNFFKTKSATHDEEVLMEQFKNEDDHRYEFQSLYNMLDDKSSRVVPDQLLDQLDPFANVVTSNVLTQKELGGLSGLGVDNDNLDQPVKPTNSFDNDLMSKMDYPANQIANSSQVDQFLRHKFTCRGHFDAVRCVAFHHSESTLFSGSEDGTVILWRLLKEDSAEDATSDLVEYEPTYVFRGHCSAVLSLVVVPKHSAHNPLTAADKPIVLFSGGLDGKICSWTIPNGVDMYASYRKAEDSGFVYSDDSSAVWALAISSYDPRYLVAGTANGNLTLFKLNDSLSSTQPHKTICLAEAMKNYQVSSVEKPTCLEFLSEPIMRSLGVDFKNLPLLLVGTSGGWICLVDFLSKDEPYVCHAVKADPHAKEIHNDWSSDGVYSITTHPTFSHIWSGHQDKLVRQTNLRKDENGAISMKVVDNLQMHEAAVCSVICEQNAGLYLYTAGIDGSIRVWDIEKRRCVQEVAAHRPKGEEAIHGLALFTRKPLLATAAADATCKVFMQPISELVSSH
ncbi:Striatin-3 [Cichlidogyrus casuarinus]|uniref:Striatin-3 n=1 Tax=Cichlidogyrus casuarinus TaxID=1844966 RepID=A0ABD2QH94_9PLAT